MRPDVASLLSYLSVFSVASCRYSTGPQRCVLFRVSLVVMLYGAVVPPMLYHGMSLCCTSVSSLSGAVAPPVECCVMRDLGLGERRENQVFTFALNMVQSR